MDYLHEYGRHITFGLLGLIFGLSFPKGHFWRFTICLCCYGCAMFLAAFSL